jgi:hypothetical protein
MRLLYAGIDLSIIALWLGHEQMETTQIYLHADLALKEKALARTTPVKTSPGRTGHPIPSLRFSRRSKYAEHGDTALSRTASQRSVSHSDRWLPVRFRTCKVGCGHILNTMIR